MYVPKYNLLGWYNITCMYVFRAKHLALDNQFVCSSLTFLSCLEFSVRGRGLMGFLPFTLACLLLPSLFSSRLGLDVGETLWV